MKVNIKMDLNSNYFNKYMFALACFCVSSYITLKVSSNGYYCDKTISKTINTIDATEQSIPLSKERKESETKKCESCSRNVPDCIVQYGIPRTATTLQFQILCLIMAMLHEDEINCVGCHMEIMKTSRKYNVIKTHNITHLLTRIPPNSWIFMTASGYLSKENQHAMAVNRQKIHNKKVTIPYIADLDAVSKHGYNIVYEYKTVFGFSDEKLKHILEYFRYWVILRQCCGLQMSSDLRNRLSPRANYKQHHDPHSPTYPACEMYNIGQVEKLFINSYAFQKFAHISSLSSGIGKPSDVDGKLTGSYCERCNDNISKHHQRFNQRCT